MTYGPEQVTVNINRGGQGWRFRKMVPDVLVNRLNNSWQLLDRFQHLPPQISSLRFCPRGKWNCFNYARMHLLPRKQSC